MTFAQLDQLKAQLDAYRPLDTNVIKNLHENLVLQWTYHSNAIEGNTLTLKETKVALEGITIGGKTLREHFEVINHREAILMVEDLVSHQELLSEREIKDLHYLVLKNITAISPSPQPSPRGRGSSEAEGEGVTAFIALLCQVVADSFKPYWWALGVKDVA